MTRQTANTSPAERREWLANQTEDPWPAVIPAMTGRQRATLPRHWHYQAHEGQLPPPGAWHCWLVMAGRGFGKTRAGAEWVREIARRDRAARIALVGASLGEVRRVMVEGPSGLLAIAAPDQRPRFEPSRGLLRWNNGAEARLYSAAEPDSLRGPQHSHACRSGPEGTACERGARATRSARSSPDNGHCLRPPSHAPAGRMLVDRTGCDRPMVWQG